MTYSLTLYIDSTRRTVASRPADRLLSDHSPSRLYAGGRRFRSFLRRQLLSASRDLFTATLATSPCQARSGSLAGSPSGPSRRHRGGGHQPRREELPRAFGAAPRRLFTGKSGPILSYATPPSPPL